MILARSKSLFRSTDALRRLFSSYPAHILVGMPALSPTMTAGTIGVWHKKVGELIKAGESIADVETDKASIGFEAQDDAYIARILVDAGQEVKVGMPILITVEEEESIAAFKDYVITASPTVSAEAPATLPASVHAVVAPIVQPPSQPASIPAKTAPPSLVKAPVVVAAPLAVAATPSVPVVPPQNTLLPTSAPVAQLSFIWGSGASKSAIAGKLAKEQAKYIEKFGRSSHKGL